MISGVDKLIRYYLQSNVLSQFNIQCSQTIFVNVEPIRTKFSPSRCHPSSKVVNRQKRNGMFNADNVKFTV